MVHKFIQTQEFIDLSYWTAEKENCGNRIPMKLNSRTKKQNGSQRNEKAAFKHIFKPSFFHTERYVLHRIIYVVLIFQKKKSSFFVVVKTDQINAFFSNKMNIINYFMYKNKHQLDKKFLGYFVVIDEWTKSNICSN